MHSCSSRWSRARWLASAIASVSSLALVACSSDDGSSTAAVKLAAEPGCAPTDGGTIAPSVSMTSPAANAIVSGVVTLAAHGTGPIQNIEFFDASGTMLGRATLAGADGTFAWDTTKLPDGPVQITAKAWDSPAGTPASFEVHSQPLSLSIANAGSTSSPTPTAANPCGDVPANALDIRAYGAMPKSGFDNRTAITNAIAAAKAAGKAVLVPAGTFEHSGTIALDGVALYGMGDSSVLRGTDPANEALVLRGTGASIHSLKLTSGATTRLSTPWSAMMWGDGASSFEVACVSVEGSGSAGIIVLRGSGGKIHHSRFHSTLADSIHMTDSTHDVDVFHNRIENSGDDGVACVSYNGVAPGDGPETDYVRDVHAWDNIILDNAGGRGMSVVGGRRVEYDHNYIRGGQNPYACVYLAQESSYSTWEANGVNVHDNDFVHCAGWAHPASLLVYAAQWPNRDIRIIDNSFWQNQGPQGSVALQGTNIDVVQSGTKVDVGPVPPLPW